MRVFKYRKKKRDEVIFLAANTFVHNDGFFPVLLYLASKGVEVKVYFETQRALKPVKESASLWNWLNKYAAEITCIESTHNYAFVKYITSKYRKFYFILSVIFSKDAVVILPPIINRVSKILDKYNNIWYFLLYGGFDYTERYNIVNGLTADQRKFCGKPPEILNSNEVKSLKKVITLSDDSKAAYSEKFEWDECLTIPFPYMQQWWHNFVKENPPKFHRKEMVKKSEFITIILLRKGNYYFANGSDVDVLLDEIISAIRKYYPDTLIVLKPKPEHRVKYWLDDDNLYDRYKDKNIVITLDTLMSLSCKTAFAVSTGQTSGNYYMLSRGVPVIEYCRYSEGWREIFPKETSIEEYGGVFVKDIKSLETCIKNIENHKVDLDKLKETIGYKDIKLDIDLF